MTNVAREFRYNPTWDTKRWRMYWKETFGTEPNYPFARLYLMTMRNRKISQSRQFHIVNKDVFIEDRNLA